MSDEPALLRAIDDRPDDDTPHLVYADWLDDNGRPVLASHIRGAVAGARDGTASGGVRRLSPYQSQLYGPHVYHLPGLNVGHSVLTPRAGGLSVTYAPGTAWGTAVKTGEHYVGVTLHRPGVPAAIHWQRVYASADAAAALAAVRGLADEGYGHDSNHETMSAFRAGRIGSVPEAGQ